MGAGEGELGEGDAGLLAPREVLDEDLVGVGGEPHHAQVLVRVLLVQVELGLPTLSLTTSSHGRLEGEGWCTLR